MIENKANKNEREVNGQRMEEMAFLVMTSDSIAVASSLDDVYEVMGSELKKNLEVSVVQGEKQELLDYAHKVMCIDNVITMENKEFQYPEIPQPNLLYSRHRPEHPAQLPKIFYHI